MTLRLCDEFEHGFGWIAEGPLARTSHALAADGVWLVDPVDVPGVEERIRALGEPRGVIQLLDRHERDCAKLARRLAVPLLEVPFAGVPDSPFEVVRVARTRFWREVALWWEAPRVLVCADALGTARYFRAPGERLGVHPLLRLVPPRRLGWYEPLHVLCGHGEGVHGRKAAPALRDALAGARRRLPAAWVAGLIHGRRTFDAG